MHYDSMYVTVVWHMGDHPKLLLGEPCAVTVGNSRSPGLCFPGRILELRLLWKIILERGPSRCARGLTLRPAWGLIYTFYGALIP